MFEGRLVLVLGARMPRRVLLLVVLRVQRLLVPAEEPLLGQLLLLFEVLVVQPFLYLLLV